MCVRRGRGRLGTGKSNQKKRGDRKEEGEEVDQDHPAQPDGQQESTGQGWRQDLRGPSSKLRQSVGLSQRQIARKLGVSRSTVARLLQKPS